ncbi:MAG: hypothetical protein GF398_12155 [Chitinivibrionales bacterium]|nr:hypothetical protein [Chitinivibrionales bacterium]
MASSDKLIALDFDGVIADSIEETFFVAYTAFRQLHSRAFWDIDLTYEDFDTQKSVLAPLLKEFRRLRPFLRVGEDYMLFLKIIHNGWMVRTQQDFDEIKKHNTHEMPAYQSAFYSTRKRCQNSAPNDWLKLAPAFGIILEGARKLADIYPVIIATTRDELSTRQLIDTYEFNVEKIISKEYNRCKREQLTYAAETFRVPLQNILFVDDQVDSLLITADAGVKSFLATWGYNNDDQRSRASKNGVDLLSAHDFYLTLYALMVAE